MDLLIDNFGFIMRGLGMTLLLSIVTLLCATLVAVVLGALAVSRLTPLRWTVRAIVEFCRDIPLIVNVFFVYFGAPLLGMDLSPFVAVTLSLATWGGANGAEIVRGGLEAVPRHQLVSAQALGLKGWEVFWFVRAPQAFKSVMPPYVGLLTQLVQATSLGALVGVSEFLRVGQIIVERTTITEGDSPAFVVYGGVLAVYFCLCSLLTWWGRRMERSLSLRQNPVANSTATSPATPAAPRAAF